MPKRRCPVQRMLRRTAKAARASESESAAAAAAAPRAPHQLAADLADALRGADTWQARNLLGASLENGVPLVQLEGLPAYLVAADLPGTAWATLAALSQRIWNTLVTNVVEEALNANRVAQARKIIDALGPGSGEPAFVRRPIASLRKALKFNQREVVDLLLDFPVRGNELDLGYGLPIRLAARRGWTGIVRKLLAAPMLDPNARPEFRPSAISSAARMGHYEIVRLLAADERVDIHLEDEDALCQAAMHGHLRVVELLLAHGANPGRVWSFPFRMACNNGHLDVARLLAEHPKTEVDQMDAEALSSACYYGADDLVERILASRRSTPLVATGEPVRIALERGHVQTARRVLADPRTPKTVASSLLASAAWSGLTEVVNELLKTTDAKASASDNIAVRVASANGHLATVVVLVIAGDADPSASQNEALRLAARGGHSEVVSFLLNNPCVDPTAEDSEALTGAAAGGFHNIVKLLLEDGRADPTAMNNLALRMALENGHEDVVLSLMRDPRVNIAHEDSRILVMAAEYGRVHVLREALAADPALGIDPTVRGNAAICLAAQNGHAEAVEALLADGRADPACENNDPIRYASRKGHSAVVRALLRDPRVDAGAENCQALIWAIEGDHEEVMRVLVEESKGAVDPAVGNHAYLMWAIALDKPEAVARLLKDPRVQPGTNNDWPLREAARMGHARIVELLARDPRVNPAAVSCLGLRDACRLGHIEVVRVLLAQPSVDPGACKNAPLRLACEYGKADIVKLLLDDERVRVLIKHQLMVRVAKEYNRPKVICVLVASGLFKLRMLWIPLMRWACELNYPGVVKVLLRDKDSRPDFDSDWAIRTCSELGHADIVETLLADGRSHPTVHNCYCFRAAVRQGSARVVRALLDADAAPSPMAQQISLDASPLVVAVKSGHFEVFCLLLENPQFAVVPTLIISAVNSNRPDMVRMLLKDERVDPTVRSSRALQLAASEDRVEIVKLLLEDGRVDVTASECLAFRKAAMRGHIVSAKMLLADPRIDPRVMNDFAMRQAASRGHDAIVRLLLEDGRCDPTLQNNDALVSAARNDHKSTVRVLLSSPRVQAKLGSIRSWMTVYADIHHVQSCMKKEALLSAEVSCMVYRALIGRTPRRGGLMHHKDLIIQILLFACSDKLIFVFDKLSAVQVRARRLIEDLIQIGEDRVASITAQDALVALAEYC